MAKTNEEKKVLDEVPNIGSWHSVINMGVISCDIDFKADFTEKQRQEITDKATAALTEIIRDLR